MNEIKKENPNIVYQTHEEMVAGLAPAIGRTIKKIGLDEYHNTCRLVLDDDNVIFVQSVAGKEYFLKHGVVADVKSGSMAYGLANATTMTWANMYSASKTGLESDIIGLDKAVN